MNKPEAILFDLDGVLFDTSAAHTEAYRLALSEFDIGSFDYADIAGMQTDEAMRNLLERAGITPSEDQLERLVDQKRLHGRRLVEDEAVLAEGCIDVLHALSKRFRLALASSSSPGNVDIFLRKSGCKALFSTILTGVDVVQAKPHPEIYLNTLKLLNIDHSQAVIVEDAPSGILAGQRAEIRVIGITGLLSTADLDQLGVSLIISRLSELLTIL
jgi:HAD superfamily hydrolase (TIGR01509 family)